MAELIKKKKKATICTLKEIQFSLEDRLTESNGMEKYILSKWQPNRKVGITIFITEEIYFKIKIIKRDQKVII